MRARFIVAAAIAGLFMGVALPIAGVTRPEVIIGWLDVFGSWDPTLLVFFASSARTFHGAWRWARARERSQSGPELRLPASRSIDGRLAGGSAIFGVGWAIAGLCPGPAFATLGAGAPWAAIFVASMLVGLYLGGLKWVPREAPASRMQRAPSS
jgi:uncharacterized protein